MKPHPRFLPRLAAGLFTLTAAGALPVAATLAVLSLAPATASAAAEEGEITFDSFYQNLADNGDWYDTAEFGYVFQPYIAYKNEAWRPYTDGYWAQTDQGWTWVSYEDFGWACYHYGRWTQLENTGWVWVPGYEWGPGWVSWRTSDDYVGWAPLPPKVSRSVATTTVRRTGGGGADEGRPVRPEDLEEDYDTGYNAGVDAQYDIGPGNYAFVPVQSFGAPYLAEAVVPVAQNIVIIEGTTNVTNIVYRRGTRGDNHRVIYCGGPDYNLVSRRVERPIPRLLLERRPAGVDISGPRPRGDRFSAVRDNRLEVFAPLVARPGAAGIAAGRPSRIKETLDRPQVIHGWRNVQQQDPRLADRLRDRFREQARQAPPARQVAENFVTPTAFRAQPPPPIQEQQRQHQPPPPRTAEGNRFNNGGNRPVEANQPPAPPAPVPAVVGPQPGIPPRPGPGNARDSRGRPAAVDPNPAAGVQPVPGPGGRNLSDAERQARRDARQREMEQRQGNRPPGPQPGNVPAAPPNVVNPAPPPATAPGQPARPNRTAEERDAYRAAKQAEKAREEAAARQNQPPPAAPPRDPNAERAHEERRPVPRPREQQPTTAPGQPPQAQPDAAREQRRAARQQEEQAQRAAQQQQQQQQAGERARAAQDQQQQQQREQRRAARQQEEQAQRGAQQQQQAAERARAEQQQQQQQMAERSRAAQEQQQRRAERQQQAPPPPQPRQAPPPEARRPAEVRPQAPAAAAAPAAQPGQPTEEELRKRKRGENAPR